MSEEETGSEERRAGWFELFFDLVFVAAVSVLAHRLAGDPRPSDFGAFLVLFFPAWWAWVNMTVTVNVFGSANRLMQAVQLAAMPALGLMAAASSDGLGSRAWAYALGAAWVRLVLFLAWWGRARREDTTLRVWRPVSYGLLPALLWGVSAAVPGPDRFVLWGVAMVLEVALLAVRLGTEERMYDALSIEHLVERISLFVVIVLGESVFTLVATLNTHFTAASGAAALLGFAAVAGLALAFFAWGTTGAARGLSRAQAGRALAAIRDTVMYLPFLLVSGITVLAAALGTAVAAPEDRLPSGACAALAGGVLAFYTANATISIRYGDGVRFVLGWYAPSLLLTAVVLVPGCLLLPAWGAVACAAGEVLALTALSKHRARARARAAG